MSIYAVHYTYRDDAEAIAAGRPEHRAYLAGLVEEGRLLASGPYVGVEPDQALLVFRADSAEAVEEMLVGDPFQRDGLVAAHEITEWNPLLGLLKDHLG